MNLPQVRRLPWYSCLENLCNQPYGIPCELQVNGQLITEYFIPIIQHFYIEISGQLQPMIYDLNSLDYDNQTIREQVDYIVKKFPRLKDTPWKQFQKKSFIVIKYNCVNQDIMNTIDYPIYCYYDICPPYIREESLQYLEQLIQPNYNYSKKEQKQPTEFQILCEFLQIQPQNYKNLQKCEDDRENQKKQQEYNNKHNNQKNLQNYETKCDISQQFYWNMAYFYNFQLKMNQLVNQQQQKEYHLFNRLFSSGRVNTFAPQSNYTELYNKSKQWWEEVEKFAGKQFIDFLYRQSEKLYQKLNQESKYSLNSKLPQNIIDILDNINTITSQLSTNLKSKCTNDYIKQQKSSRKERMMQNSASIKTHEQFLQTLDKTFLEALVLLNNKQTTTKIHPEMIKTQDQFFVLKSQHIFCSEPSILFTQQHQYDQEKNNIKRIYGQIYGYDESVIVQLSDDDSSRKANVKFRFSEIPE